LTGARLQAVPRRVGAGALERAATPSRRLSAATTWFMTSACPLILCVAIVLHFHDRFWYATDEGNYANVAERVLNGEVLNGAVQDLHPGYVSFVNALAFRLFGLRLVSLRYPLALLTIIQSALLLLLLTRRSRLLAAAAALAMASLSFVQFLNPTANWYALFCLVVLMAWLSWVPAGHAGRLEGAGFAVTALTLFRQLSGMLVGIGLLAFLLIEGQTQGRSGRPFAGRLLALGMLLSLGAYLAWVASVDSLLLFGVWPLLLIVWTIAHTRVGARDLLGMLGRLARGAAVASLPLVTYHAVHRSLHSWFDDVVLHAAALPDLALFDARHYLHALVVAFLAVGSRAPVPALNGLFWITVLCLAALNGVLTFRALRRGAHPHPVPFLAVFWAVVSVHYEIPIYLLYSLATSLTGVLWWTSEARPHRRWWGAGLAAYLIAVGLVFQAAQPLTRLYGGVLTGVRDGNLTRGDLPRLGLLIPPGDAALYGELVALIQRQVAPGQPILALPSAAELYFLADRPNPARFFNSAMGVHGAGDVEAVVQTLETRRPRLVIYDPSDKYNTSEARQIMAHVRQHYIHTHSMGQFEIYTREELR
jgi:hypothetical protein